MKILIATSSVTPNAGIPSYNRELCSLLENTNDMHLLVDEDIAEYHGYTKVYSTSRLNIYGFEDCKNLVFSLCQEQYDIIINSNSHIMSIIAPYMNDATRIITISHSLGTMDCDNAAFNNKYIDNIVALSANCKKYIEKRFRISKDNKVSVIFNSVTNRKDAKEICDKKKKTNTLKIVFAGGTASSKSPDLVIPIIWELCKTKLSFKFYWMGITTPPLKKIQPFKDVRLILPKDPRVIVTGHIPQKEAAEIIAGCNVFLAPSRREGFPMALLEAMRVGCIPVVSDFNIANKEIINNGVNGFIVPHKNIHQFVALLTKLIEHHPEYWTIYDESYNTFVNKLCFTEWHKKINTLIAETKCNHKSRQKISRWHFVFNVWRFRLLDRYNLIENHIFEVIPCAIKFNRFYKKNQKTYSHANRRR